MSMSLILHFSVTTLVSGSLTMILAFIVILFHDMD